MRAGVIGGGVAGLVTAKVLKQDGFEVSVFEKEPSVGGVWAASRAYPGLSTNNPRETYVFSDFPHADTTGDFPTAAQVRDYLDAYVDAFGLRSDLHLGTEVVAVGRAPHRSDGELRGFRITVRSCREELDQQTLAFDFIVVCNGVLSEPFVPRFEGVERFSGQILHSSRVPEADGLRGKQVLVVGAGKSALDCANVAGREADACTLVFRKPYWVLPRYFFGLNRVDRQVFNRATELITFPAYHTLSRGEAALRHLGMPLRPLLWLFRKLQCRVIAWQSSIPAIMVPDAPIHRYIYHQGIGAEVYDGIRRGRVIPKRAGIDAFLNADTVRLDTGEEIAADLVICGTGWHQTIDFLDVELQEVVRPDGRFRLYRHILPPAEQRMGFIGYASSGNTPLTAEVAAHWLSASFRGEMQQPAATDMERNIDAVLAWTESVFPEQHEGHFIGGYIAHYVDWLMQDMGLRTRRARSVFDEYFGPFWAARYRDLKDERRRAARR